ncbi:MAG: hypothetical protein KDK00_02845 [Rhodobacteraceae bacterium]|nr:hypothetical protein [Paracoccaceae bacterium]
MALPLAPVAAVALRYGAVALVAYAASRRVHTATIRQDGEDALDAVPEGVGAARPRDRSQVNAEARWRRIIRLGASGPGLEIDASALGRVTFRRV